MRPLLSCLALTLAMTLLASCGAPPLTAPKAEPPKAEAPKAAPAPEAAPRANMAPLAYELSRHSPLITAATRNAISQDFNGAPLSGPAKTHQITANEVRCRARNVEAPPSAECTMTYAVGAVKTLSGEDGKALFDALLKAGVEGDAGMGHVERIVTGLTCTIDDAAAQNTPATGDAVAGFACQFTVY